MKSENLEAKTDRGIVRQEQLQKQKRGLQLAVNTNGLLLMTMMAKAADPNTLLDENYSKVTYFCKLLNFKSMSRTFTQ